jgi:hypothetical protein
MLNQTPIWTILPPHPLLDYVDYSKKATETIKSSLFTDANANKKHWFAFYECQQKGCQQTAFVNKKHRLTFMHAGSERATVQIEPTCCRLLYTTVTTVGGRGIRVTLEQSF